MPNLLAPTQSDTSMIETSHPAEPVVILHVPIEKVEIEHVHASVDSDATRAEHGPDRYDRREPARGEQTNDQTLLDRCIVVNSSS